MRGKTGCTYTKNYQTMEAKLKIVCYQKKFENCINYYYYYDFGCTVISLNIQYIVYLSKLRIMLFLRVNFILCYFKS